MSDRKPMVKNPVPKNVASNPKRGKITSYGAVKSTGKPKSATEAAKPILASSSLKPSSSSTKNRSSEVLVPESFFLGSLPMELVRSIVEYLQFAELLGLWLCGDHKLCHLLANGAIVATELVNWRSGIIGRYPKVLQEWSGLRKFSVHFSNVPLEPADFWAHRTMLRSLTTFSLQVSRSLDLMRFGLNQLKFSSSDPESPLSESYELDLDSLFPNLTDLSWNTIEAVPQKVKWPSQLIILKWGSNTYRWEFPASLTSLTASTHAIDWSKPLPNLTYMSMRDIYDLSSPLPSLPLSVTDLGRSGFYWPQISMISALAKNSLLLPPTVRTSLCAPLHVGELLANAYTTAQMVSSCVTVSSLDYQGPGETSSEVVEALLNSNMKSLCLTRCQLPSMFPSTLVKLDVLMVSSTKALGALLSNLPRKGLRKLVSRWLDSNEVSGLPTSLLSLTFSDRVEEISSRHSVLPNLGGLPRSLTKLKLVAALPSRAKKPSTNRNAQESGWDHTFFKDAPTQLLSLKVNIPSYRMSVTKVFQALPQGLELLDLQLKPIKHSTTPTFQIPVDFNMLPRDLRIFSLHYEAINVDSFKIEWPKALHSLSLSQVTKDVLHQLPPSLRHLSVTLPRLGYIGSIQAKRLVSLHVTCPKEPLEPHMLQNLPPTLLSFIITRSRQQLPSDPAILKAAFDLWY